MGHASKPKLKPKDL